MKLYARQQDEVTRALKSPQPIRWLYAVSTGGGKSAMALHTIGPGKTLIVAPAIMRRPWLDEIAKWIGETNAAAIEVGRKRKLSKPKAAVRDAAYSADIQVVSYDLLPEVDGSGWSNIIFDECHELGNPLSKQSIMGGFLVEQNYNANVIMLSATPIPRIIKQVWYPLYLLNGAEWGKPSKTGDISWEFGRKYLNIIKNEYGTSIGNSPSDGQIRALNAKIATTSSRLTMEDIAPEMPPINVSKLSIDSITTGVYKDWIKSLESDVTHAVILCHLKETARTIADIGTALGKTVTYIDGTIPAGKRSDLLKKVAAAPDGLLVGTYDSLSVGIRLLFAQKALIVEFSGTPGTTAQVLGRFASVGTQARPKVQLLVGPRDRNTADVLLDRMARIGGVIQAAGNENALHRALESSPEEGMENLLDMFNDSEGWETKDEHDID